MLPTHLRYTTHDQWVKVEDDEIVVGLTDHAQEHLDEVTHVDLPEPDDHHHDADEEVGQVDGINAALDLFTPVAGVITGVNLDLHANPDCINRDPYELGWIFRMQPDDPDSVEQLLDADDYEAMLPDEDEED